MPRNIICKRLLSGIIIMMLAVFSLRAGGWRYAVVGEDEEYCSLLESVIDMIPSVTDENTLSLIAQREYRDRVVSYEKSVASAYSQDKASTISTIAFPTLEGISEAEKEKVQLRLDSYYPFLEEGGEDTNRYLCQINDLDALFFVKSETEGSLRSITLYLNGEVFRKALFSSDLKSFEEEELLTLLSSLLLGDGYSTYRIIRNPDTASLLIDGEAVSSSFVVLEKGSHTFSLSSYGYGNAKYSMEVGDEKTIEVTMEREEPHSVYVSSLPWDSKVWVDGIEKEDKFIPSIYSPFTLTLESDGFSTLSYESGKKDSVVRISLKPEWTSDSSILEKKKNSFYSSIFTTLLSFGGMVASEAVDKINGGTTAALSRVVLKGVSIVSLINMFRTAVDYYSYSGF